MSNTIIDLVYDIKLKCTANDDTIRQKTALSPAEYRALISLNSGEDISAACFSKRLGLSPSRGSRVIDKMVESGFIRRESVKGDRRSLKISLAPKGLTLKRTIQSMMRDCEQKIREKLSPDEYMGVADTLKKLAGILSDF